MTQPREVLVVEDIHKRFGGLEVLKGISPTIALTTAAAAAIRSDENSIGRSVADAGARTSPAA